MSIIFENDSPKGSFWANEKKVEFLLLSPDSRKLLTTSLKTVENTGNHNGHTRCESVLMILLVKCSYFEIFIVANRPCFFPRTFPYNGSFRNWVTQRVTLSWTNRLLFLDTRELETLVIKHNGPIGSSWWPSLTSQVSKVFPFFKFDINYFTIVKRST